MNPKKQLYYIAAVVAMSILASLYMFIGSPVVIWHNHQLASALTGLTDESVTLEQAVPFSWDEVYFFPPYTSLEEIRQTIGADSPNLSEATGEGMLQLVFLDDGSVTAAVCGYPDSLGYDIVRSDAASLPGKLSYGGNVRFAVERAGGTVTLREAAG